MKRKLSPAVTLLLVAPSKTLQFILPPTAALLVTRQSMTTVSRFIHRDGDTSTNETRFLLIGVQFSSTKSFDDWLCTFSYMHMFSVARLEHQPIFLVELTQSNPVFCVDGME